MKDETAWGEPAHATATATSWYGKAAASCWDRLHHRLTRRAAWLGHDGALPIIDGTLIRLQVEQLPGERDPKPVWLWTSAVAITRAHLDRLWQAFLRRFDLEHTFRMWKQTLGWTAPKIRDPQAADRWTWLIIIAYAQLRLARTLAPDLRRPWERPAPPERLTPARVRRGFRHLPPAPASTCRCAEAHPARSQQASGLEEPGSRASPRRGQDHQTRRNTH